MRARVSGSEEGESGYGIILVVGTSLLVSLWEIVDAGGEGAAGGWQA